jgi:hypothetical protein
MKAKLVEFTPPKGFMVPEGKMAGDTIELMAEFQLKPNGKICLVSIEGNDMPGYKDDGADDDKGYPMGGGKFAQSYLTSMAPNPNGAP